MRNIKICKREKDALYFILSEFIRTHNDECGNIYDDELKLSKRLVEELR